MAVQRVVLEIGARVEMTVIWEVTTIAWKRVEDPGHRGNGFKNSSRNKMTHADL